MRSARGSMMDSVASQPDDIARAVDVWMEAMLPDAPAAPGTARPSLALLPLRKGMALHAQWNQHAWQQARHLSHTAGTLPRLLGSVDAAQEALDLLAAWWQQCGTLQAQWLQGLTEWGQEAAELRHANTVSKQVDQEMNLIAQAFALCTNQATAAARLLENTQVNVAWWLEKRAAA